MAGDGDTERRGLQRDRELLDQAAGAVIRHLGAVGEHRAAILIDDLQVEALLGLLEHDVLGHLGQFRHVLQRLAQRGRGERKVAVDLDLRARRAVAVLLIRRRRVGGVLGLDVVDVLQPRAGRQAVGLDDTGVARLALHAECVAHGAGDDLQLVGVLRRERDEHHEEAHHQAHQVGEGHEPAVTATVSIAALLLGHLS